jgi:heme/copper-type cytochrome/quinol oxidase subunit 2
MSTLADSGAVALEAIIVAIVASIVVPAVILAGVCWVFYRAKKREAEAARPGWQSLRR